MPEYGLSLLFTLAMLILTSNGNQMMSQPISAPELL
jgi:hypothetical protein